MLPRYYTKTFEEKGTTLRVVWVDTAPMIDKYRQDSEQYPDACKQDYQKQLAWIDSVLTVASEDWVIVAGHHPFMRRLRSRIANALICRRVLIRFLKNIK